MQLGGRQQRDEVLIGCSESDLRGLAPVCTYQVFDLTTSTSILLEQLRVLPTSRHFSHHGLGLCKPFCMILGGCSHGTDKKKQ